MNLQELFGQKVKMCAEIGRWVLFLFTPSPYFRRPLAALSFQLSDLWKLYLALPGVPQGFSDRRPGADT